MFNVKKVGCWSISVLLGMWLLLGFFCWRAISLKNLIEENNEELNGLLIEDDFFPEKIEGYFMCLYPKIMEVDVPDDFRVWITRDSIRDFRRFARRLSIDDSVFIEKVRVGHIMEVNLIETDTTIKDFEINLLNSKEQILDKHSPAIWQWKIKPLNEGVHSLTVIAKIKMMTRDLKLVGYKDLPVIEREIVVEANKWQISAVPSPNKDKRNYYWLSLIPILGLIIWFIIRKKRKPENQLIPEEEYEDFRTAHQDLIKNDRISKSFELFENILIKYNYKVLKKQLVHLKSNYSNNESRYNKNLIYNDEFNLNRSKVIDEILDLPSKLKVKKDDT